MCLMTTVTHTQEFVLLEVQQNAAAEGDSSSGYLAVRQSQSKGLVDIWSGGRALKTAQGACTGVGFKQSYSVSCLAIQ